MKYIQLSQKPKPASGNDKWMVTIAPILLAFVVVNVNAVSGWKAYNDCVYEKGVQFHKKNVTTFGLGRGNPLPEEGKLVQFKMGKETGIIASFIEHKSQGNTINWAKDESMFNDGSDADKIFGDIADATGNMSYNDGPGWHLDLVFSGLKADSLYTFVGTVNRNGGPGYKERITNWTIMGADSFIYKSSGAAHKIGEDSVEFSTGENDEGLIARWEDIRSGDDGEFQIRTSHSIGSKKGGIKNAHAFKGYAGGLFMLEYNGVALVELIDKLATRWATIRSRP
jgi:hypothetical protein